MSDVFNAFITELSRHTAGINLSTMFEKVFPRLVKNPTPHKESSLYMKLYRIAHTYHNFWTLTKQSGLIWLKPERALFDLISARVKLKNCKTEWNSIPKKLTPYRLQSILFTKNIKMQNEESSSFINERYQEYLGMANDKVLFFEKRKFDQFTKSTMWMKYKTRFNDPRIPRILLDRFDSCIQNSIVNYKRAVFLTLTTAPDMFSNLWDANRHFQIAWNKFMSFLAGKYGSRPKYIAAFEFTKKTGLLHCHAIIFGRGWLLEKDEITKKWMKYGQGMINHIYSLQNNNGSWHWLKDKPKDHDNKSADDYLKKYIKKAIYGNTDFQNYWIYNKRFYTNSYSLFPSTEILDPKIPIWRYLGAWNVWDLPDWLVEKVPMEAFYEEKPD
jgi:hypothetical protein